MYCEIWSYDHKIELTLLGLHLKRYRRESTVWQIGLSKI